jgi:hypothetical protein
MNAIVKSRFADTPAMQEFNISNHLLGDRAALDAAFARDGYWFFRNVLDLEAVARLRAVYLEILNQLGVIEPGHDDAAIYNGAPLDHYPIKMSGDPSIDPLLKRYPANAFVQETKIKAFFEELFGGEVFWVPNTEFHAVPPNHGHSGKRLNYVHQDGANNKGLRLKVCWIPVAPIDEEMGGLALTEGLHTPRLNDFPRPWTGIRDEDVPQSAWRRTTYQPGDLLVFSLESPHSGLANRSDKYFRLSMDIRGMLKSDNPPLLGKVAAVDMNAIAIEDADGKQHVFRIDDMTFCRTYRGVQSGIPLARDEIPQLMKPGEPVFVASEDGVATFIRPRH